jgi:hypothetical protein
LSIARRVLTVAAGCLICSGVVAAQGAAVVTVDAATHAVKCDDDKLQTRAITPEGEQIGAFVQNTTLEPLQFTAKITGLKDQKYDVYINSDYLGAKDARELASGLQLTLPGRISDPDMMLCLNTVKPIVDAEYLRLQGVRAPEPARVAATLQQAVDWVRSGIKTEEVYRSVAIVIAPEGRALQRPRTPTRLGDVETAAAVTRACWLLQKARARMSSVIRDPDLRDTAVAAMTPVDLTTSFTVKDGKPHVEATVTNYCNLPISGEITADIPKGWKWDAKHTTFADLKTGKSFTLSFDLSATVPDAAPPDGVKVAAAVKLAQDRFKAEYRIRTIARTATPESAVMPKADASRPSPAPRPRTVKPAEKTP